jgi:3-deoxy-7-phosphoheptulonate synthase
MEKEKREMIIILKENAEQKEVFQLKEELKSQGFQLHESTGTSKSLIGLIGDTAKLDVDQIQAYQFVERVQRIQEPYKKANKKMHPLPTIVDVNGVSLGGGNFQVIAGPCSIESKEQMTSVAKAVKQSGAGLLRGGAFKPRTSPYSFQGLHDDGIQLLLEAKKETGLPIVTEIMSMDHIDLFEEVDVIQVGARNMQNFELLKELGKLDKPILLKRGLCNTLEELLMSAEYIMAGGNENVILCERGIRTFENAYRNTLDISAVPMLKTMTHLPVVIDPSHAAGLRFMVEPLAMSAIAAGADGLMIEVHNNPEKALCDGPQSLTPAQFDDLMGKVRMLQPVCAKFYQQ